MKIFGNPLLEKAMSASWKRNEVIAENIANVDTPGYKRQDINFEDYFKQALKKDSITGRVTNEAHIPINSKNIEDMDLKKVRDYTSTSMRMDGNNVDIDVEMAELAKNQILFNSYTTLLNKDFSITKSAIRGGN